MSTPRFPIDATRAPGLSAAARSELESAFAEMHTLEDVVRWGFSSTAAKPIVEVVVQDEYTHDVVVEVTAGECYVVFDTT